jgi:predicted trehalose synthase
MTDAEALAAAFEKLYPNLQWSKPGRFVLFQDGVVVGDFSSFSEAQDPAETTGTSYLIRLVTPPGTQPSAAYISTVAKAVRDRAEQEEVLAALRNEATKLGTTLSRIGKLMTESPEEAFFTASDVDAVRAATLADDIRASIKTLSALNKEINPTR